jgi:hypothetical protein
LGSSGIPGLNKGPLQLSTRCSLKENNRVYEAKNHRFTAYDQDVALVDSEGREWNLSEDALKHDDLALARLPAHRAFWFGWHSAFPDTQLVR